MAITNDISVQDEAIRLLGRSQGLDGLTGPQIVRQVARELVAATDEHSDAYCLGAFLALAAMDDLRIVQIRRDMRIAANYLPLHETVQ